MLHPWKERQYILDTYASNQVQDNEEKVIAYGSKQLSKTKKNYFVTREELLTVVHFVTPFE